MKKLGYPHLFFKVTLTVCVCYSKAECDCATKSLYDLSLRCVCFCLNDNGGEAMKSEKCMFKKLSLFHFQKIIVRVAAILDYFFC